VELAGRGAASYETLTAIRQFVSGEEEAQASGSPTTDTIRPSREEADGRSRRSGKGRHSDILRKLRIDQHFIKDGKGPTSGTSCSIETLGGKKPAKWGGERPNMVDDRTDPRI